METQPYPPNPEIYESGADNRLRCWFCPNESVALAPRHSGGDINVPAHWLPVCSEHAANWFRDTDPDERLPLVPRDRVAPSEPPPCPDCGQPMSYGDGDGSEEPYYVCDGPNDRTTARGCGHLIPAPDPSEPGVPGNDDDRYEVS